MKPIISCAVALATATLAATAVAQQPSEQKTWFQERVAAPTSLSPNRPAPLIGESPTRPRILNARPLVVTIPDSFPFESIATVAIVS